MKLSGTDQVQTMHQLAALNVANMRPIKKIVLAYARVSIKFEVGSWLEKNNGLSELGGRQESLLIFN